MIPTRFILTDRSRNQCAEEFGCAIVGGDTNSWPGPLVIDVAMIAEPIAVRGPVRRSDARVGDTIYVSGRWAAASPAGT